MSKDFTATEACHWMLYRHAKVLQNAAAGRSVAVGFWCLIFVVCVSYRTVVCVVGVVACIAINIAASVLALRLLALAAAALSASRFATPLCLS